MILLFMVRNVCSPNSNKSGVGGGRFALDCMGYTRKLSAVFLRFWDFLFRFVCGYSTGANCWHQIHSVTGDRRNLSFIASKWYVPHPINRGPLWEGLPNLGAWLANLTNLQTCKILKMTDGRKSLQASFTNICKLVNIRLLTNLQMFVSFVSFLVRIERPLCENSIKTNQSINYCIVFFVASPVSPKNLPLQPPRTLAMVYALWQQWYTGEEVTLKVRGWFSTLLARHKDGWNFSPQFSESIKCFYWMLVTGEGDVLYSWIEATFAPMRDSFRLTSDTENKREGCWASGIVFGKKKRSSPVTPNLFLISAFMLDLLICSFL